MQIYGLERGDVLGLGAFHAFTDLEGDFLSLIERDASACAPASHSYSQAS